MITVKNQSKRDVKKVFGVVLGVILISILLFFYIRFSFVWGEGVKSGELNYVVYKGYVFKTYEGKLIQSGIRASGGSGFESNTFEFSISNKNVAEELMMSGGKEVDLHYKEYLGKLPWRGNSRYVVDSIIAIKDPDGMENSFQLP